MQLGFLSFEVAQADAWHSLLTSVCGLVDVGAGRYRMDGHAWRFEVLPGELDDLAAVGWEVDDAELDGVVARLRAAGHEVLEADATPRGALRRYTTVDPAGVPTELVSGLPRANTPFVSGRVPGGFVGDDLGLGHIVLTAPDRAASEAFYSELLGFRLSDHIRTTFFGHDVDLAFYHVNPRHHSLALGGPQRKRLEHFLLEAREQDAVGAAYDRTIRAGHRIHLTLGKHPNDEMFSFYARTPSRFHFEFGWGGRQLDPSVLHEPCVYDRISDWGHHPPAMLAPRSR